MSKTAAKKSAWTDTPVKAGEVVATSNTSNPGATESKPTAPRTGEPKLRIANDVTRRIRQHARAHMKTEVCGVLIGESTEGTIEIRASIEALNAAQAGTHVTFTQDAWEEIYKVKDELYPEERIVGWYHSHPGFGIFLSEHDLFIQENFFSSPGQVAWVYDPHSDDEGCFGWVEGNVARLTSIATLYHNCDPVEHATRGLDSEAQNNNEENELDSHARSSHVANVPIWIVVSRTVLTHLTVLLTGFALAFYFFPRLLALLPDPSGAIMVVDYHELRSYLDGKSAAPKPLDVFDPPSSTKGHSLSGTSANPVPVPVPSASPGSSPPTLGTAPPTLHPPVANPPVGQPGSQK